MKITYKNRHNEDLYFELAGDEVKVTNVSHPLRTGFSTAGTRIDFVDPAGGPWLYVGMGLGIIDPSLKNKIVDAIRLEEDYIVLEVSDKK